MINQQEGFPKIWIMEANIGIFDGKVYMDFAPGSDKEDDIESYSLESQYVANQMLFAANKCYYTIIEDQPKSV